MASLEPQRRSYKKLPRHVGRNRLYTMYFAKIFRQQVPDVIHRADGPEKRSYQRELMATVGPFFAKTRGEFCEYLRQVAQANMGMGRYDWTFEIDDRGVVQVKTREDIGRDNQQAPEDGTLSRTILKPQ